MRTMRAMSAAELAGIELEAREVDAIGWDRSVWSVD
jgi:hypothetical protein